MEKQVQHKPGVFKHPNKTHKTGRHRSKGEILKTNKGKVGIKIISRKNKDIQSKDQRKNRLVQIRKNKRDEILNKKRCIGSLSGSPHIVVNLSFSKINSYKIYISLEFIFKNI
jgi:pre-rRNA-processing protein TSR1